MTKILGCSVTGITKEVAEEWGIILLPYYAIYQNKTENELTMDKVGFYRWLRTSPELATTSHPSLEDLRKAFLEAGKDGSELIHVCLSSAYSETYKLAIQAQKELPEIKVTIFDTLSAAGAEALITIAAAKLVKEGKSAEEVRAALPDIARRVDSRIVLDTLKYLARGGRIHKAQALLGSMLRVKPVIRFDEEGMTAPVDRVRTRTQGLELVLKDIDAFMKKHAADKLWLVIEDSDAREWADQVKERLTAEFKPEKLWQWTLTPVVGAHIGPDAWGVYYYCPAS